MKYNIINFLVFYLILHISIAHSEAITPYEICKAKKEGWTNKIAKEASQFNLYQSSGTTEASDPCATCATNNRSTAVFLDSRSEVERIGNVSSPPGSNDIPSICFHASALLAVGQSRRRFYGCASKNSEWPDHTNKMRPCLNKNYVNMTAKVFNNVANCFNFSLEEKKAIFALFNHESRFILNARSPKKARCYGQMTMKSIKYVNQNIYYRNHGFKYGDVYKDAVKNCSGLSDKVIPSELITETRFSTTRLDRKMKKAPITCGLTQDPHACLFYSMFNVKMNLKEFNDNYNEIPDYMGSRRELSKKMEKDFQLPIMLNEALVVRGTIRNKTTGKRESIDKVFSDASQIHDEFKNIEYNAGNLKIKKVPLFKKETLENVFLHYAHNGGRSIVSTHLKVFLEGIKKRVAGIKTSKKEISCSKDQTCSRYRSSLRQGKTLNMSDLQDAFVAYAKRNRLKNVKELVKFTQKIDLGLDFLHNTDGEISTSLAQIKTSIGSDKNNFINQVKKACPDSVY